MLMKEKLPNETLHDIAYSGAIGGRRARYENETGRWYQFTVRDGVEAFGERRSPVMGN